MFVIACLLALNWFVVSYWRRQQALQWWLHRHWAALHQEAETLRNESLQSSFVLRRHLELSLSQSYPNLTSDDRMALTTTEQLHQALQALSDRLSPPYLEDSLPLAIQSSLESWKSRCPNVQIELISPPDWRQGTYEQRRTILMILQELLELTLPQIPGEAMLTIRLQQPRNRQEIRVQLAIPQGHLPACPAAIYSLCEVYRVLLQDRCTCDWKSQAITCYFRWR